jgi:hypothetical protein
MGRLSARWETSLWRTNSGEGESWLPPDGLPGSIEASSAGVVAEPEYRSAALLLLDRVINQPGVDLYVNNTIGPEAVASFSVFQCPRVPVGVWDRAAFWITRYQGFFEGLLAGLHCPPAKPLSYPLSPLLSSRTSSFGGSCERATSR